MTKLLLSQIRILRKHISKSNKIIRNIFVDEFIIISLKILNFSFQSKKLYNKGLRFDILMRYRFHDFNVSLYNFEFDMLSQQAVTFTFPRH